MLPDTNMLQLSDQTGVSVDDRLALPLLPPIGHAMGTACRMADRPDSLDANYRRVR